MIRNIFRVLTVCLALLLTFYFTSNEIDAAKARNKKDGDTKTSKSSTSSKKFKKSKKSSKIKEDEDPADEGGYMDEFRLSSQKQEEIQKLLDNPDLFRDLEDQKDDLDKESKEDKKKRDKDDEDEDEYVGNSMDREAAIVTGDNVPVISSPDKKGKIYTYLYKGNIAEGFETNSKETDSKKRSGTFHKVDYFYKDNVKITGWVASKFLKYPKGDKSFARGTEIYVHGQDEVKKVMGPRMNKVFEFDHISDVIKDPSKVVLISGSKANPTKYSTVPMPNSKLYLMSDVQYRTHGIYKGFIKVDGKYSDIPEYVQVSNGSGVAFVPSNKSLIYIDGRKIGNKFVGIYAKKNMRSAKKKNVLKDIRVALFSRTKEGKNGGYEFDNITKIILDNITDPYIRYDGSKRVKSIDYLYYKIAPMKERGKLKYANIFIGIKGDRIRADSRVSFDGDSSSKESSSETTSSKRGKLTDL